MILGYILLDIGGLPILHKELVKIFTEEKRTLFSGAISAVGGLMSEVFQSKIKHLEMEKYHLYFGFGEDFIIILISDIEDERLEEISELIVKKLEEWGISTDRIQVDQEEAKRAQELIDKILFSMPPSMDNVRKLVNVLMSFIDEDKGDKLAIENVVPKVYKPSILTRIKVFFKGTTSLGELIELYYKGQFKEIVEKAQALFSENKIVDDSGVKVSDLAKIIYVKAALNLNSFDPRVEAPQLDEVYTIINNIEDPFARDFLKAELEAFTNIGSYNKKREIFLRRQREAFTRLARSGIVNRVYSILVSPLPYGPLLDYLEKVYDGVSDFLLYQVKEMKILLDFLTGRPGSPEEVFQKVAELKRLFEDEYSKDSLAKYSLFHMYFFSLTWGMLELNLNKDEVYKMIKQAWDLFKKYKRDMIDEAIYVTNRHKAVNLYFALQIIYRILLELGDDEAISLIDELYDEVKRLLSWFISLGKTRRVMLDMYYTALAGFFAFTSRLAFEKGKYIADILKVIDEFLTVDLEKFWFYNEYHYAHLYVDLLETIGNIAHFLDFKTLRRNILMQVAFGIERVARLFEETPLIHDLELVKAIRFYLLTGTSEGETKAKQIIEELKRSSSKFLTHLAEKIYEKYRG